MGATLRILIINSNRDKFPWPVAPLGACYVASSLKAAGFRVKFLDLLFFKDQRADIADNIQKFSPDFIGVSIRNIDNCDWQSPLFYLNEVKLEVIDVIRRNIRSPIVIGGAAVNIMPERLMDFFGADYAVYGDGEETFVQLAKRLQARADISGLTGLLYR